MYRSSKANIEVVEIFGLVLALGRELKLRTVDFLHVLFVKAFNVAMCLRINRFSRGLFNDAVEVGAGTEKRFII